jgi:serine protease inhibitor ecotin
LIVYDFTNYCCSYFLNKKSSLEKKVTIIILELKDEDIKVKILRYCHAGKNLEYECKSKSLGIVFEYKTIEKREDEDEVIE